MRANAHTKLKPGTIFINKKGERMMIRDYDRYKGNNHYYKCISIDLLEDETEKKLKLFNFPQLEARAGHLATAEKNTMTMIYISALAECTTT